LAVRVDLLLRLSAFEWLSSPPTPSGSCRSSQPAGDNTRTEKGKAKLKNFENNKLDKK
jgi:hypothetical protein